MNFNSLTEWLTNNPFLNLIFLILAIASVVISIFLYFKSKKIKEPTYLIKNFSIIDDSISVIKELNIKYMAKDIKRLTISKISFWNNGRETIEGSDIAPADKLRIKMESDEEIISAKVILESRKANNINVNIENNETFIYFDFLDYGDGAILDIYHTGSAEISPKIVGTIKGANPIKYGQYEKDYILYKVVDPLFGWTDNLGIKKGSIVEKLSIIIILPLLLPFVLIFSPIDAILSYFYKIPKEYNLAGVNTNNKKLHPTIETNKSLEEEQV